MFQFNSYSLNKRKSSGEKENSNTNTQNKVEDKRIRVLYRNKRLKLDYSKYNKVPVNTGSAPLSELANHISKETSKTAQHLSRKLEKYNKAELVQIQLQT